MPDLFDQLQSEGEAGILRLIEERKQEDVELDFKTKLDATTGTFSDSDRRVLAKVLSAFSNSAGGVVIWGVDARPNADRIDCAMERKPISDIERFQSEALSLVGQLIQPKHDGIEVALVRSNDHPGAGYMLMRIARSERRPHRSEAKDQKQYFKRSGGSSFPMEHYDIEDAFRRVSSPTLTLTARIQRADILYGNLIFAASIFLHNSSHISAKMPYIGALINESIDYQSIDRNAFEITNDGLKTYITDTKSVINPGVKKVMAPLRLMIPSSSGQNHISIVRGQLSFTKELWFGCLDSRMQYKVVEFGHDALRSWVPDIVSILDD